MTEWRAHDLLWITGAPVDSPLPPWADVEWMARAPLVVRRARAIDGRIPAGLRGRSRSERHACHIETSAVQRGVRPETLAALPVPTGQYAALDALFALAPRLNDSGWSWGPTGGVGFALASGLPVLRADSDLDLLLRIGQPPSASQASALHAIAASVSGCRLDLQIDTGHGGFAYAEWVAGRGKVLLKTDSGPVLAADPWSPQLEMS